MSRPPFPRSEVPANRLPSRSVLLAPYRGRVPRTREFFEDEPPVTSEDPPGVSDPPAPEPR